jgi:hypothetical protein
MANRHSVSLSPVVPLMFSKILIANRGEIAQHRHAGLDPASALFFFSRCKGRRIPGQARDDGLGHP